MYPNTSNLSTTIYTTKDRLS